MLNVETTVDVDRNYLSLVVPVSHELPEAVTEFLSETSRALYARPTWCYENDLAVKLRYLPLNS
ncbi:hypothetical protein DPMN_052127 [Dreissena polymorpha]|uniref:Uncharacterized protein n=1 Tax=Dreissena polymorpha TaxID=45954 RepID=A0A9D4CKF2_DREPO|nr:hypothetical protein DPMN_052127 [Dreissena polymorpha]